MIMFAHTSHDAWTTIERSFASQSSVRAMQLRDQLRETKKLDSSVAVFYNKIKALSDTLTSIGQLLRPEEFQSYVLNGLDEEYDSLVEAVKMRENPMPAHDLYTHMLSTEQRMEGCRSSGQHIHSANLAKMGGGKNFRSTPSGAPSSSAHSAPPSQGQGYAPRPNSASAAGGGSAAPSGRGAGRGSIICQLCDASGHMAARCFKRFNKSFLGVGNDGRFLDRQLALANHVYTDPQGQTSSLPVDPHWYMDTGATEHLTGQLEKLNTQEPYHGKDQVYTANGAGMRISLVGQAILPTP